MIENLKTHFIAIFPEVVVGPRANEKRVKYCTRVDFMGSVVAASMLLVEAVVKTTFYFLMSIARSVDSDRDMLNHYSPKIGLNLGSIVIGIVGVVFKTHVNQFLGIPPEGKVVPPATA